MIFSTPATYETRDGRKVRIKYSNYGSLLHGYFLDKDGKELKTWYWWTVIKSLKRTRDLEGDFAQLFLLPPDEKHKYNWYPKDGYDNASDLIRIIT